MPSFKYFLILTALLPRCLTAENETYPLPQRRIRGGVLASTWDSQFIASIAVKLKTPNKLLSDYYRHLCGLSIVSNGWGVTSAHCVCNFAQELNARLVVRYGSNQLSALQMHEIEAIYAHPRYGREMGVNDIAVVDFKIDGYKAPPVLLREDPFDDAVEVVVYGWGITDTENWPEVLMKFTGKTIRKRECKQRVGGDSGPGGSNICLYQDQGVGPQAGDIGGPVLYKKGGNNYLVGFPVKIMSTEHCQQFQFLTDISMFAMWINSILDPNNHNKNATMCNGKTFRSQQFLNLFNRPKRSKRWYKVDGRERRSGREL